MLRNYIKVAIRNLIKNRMFSIVNIIGLAIGMATCMLIIVIILDQTSYDEFHPDKDRIYRIISDRTSRSSSSFSTVPFPMYEAAVRKFPGIEKAVRIQGRLGGDVTYEEQTVPLRGLFAEPTFFDLFAFEIADGNPSQALSEPYSVLLTEESLAKFDFGSKSPIGEVIKIGNLGDFKITGIVKDHNHKTHMRFDILASFSTVRPLEEAGKLSPFLDRWDNTNSGFIYVKLDKHSNPDELEAYFPAISDEQYADMENYRLDFRLQALTSITPAEMLENDISNTMPLILVQFLSILSILIIITACFNYTNLSVARALTRAKEIGLRKVVGASRPQIFVQFVSEAIIVSVLSLAFAWCLLEIVMIPNFENLFFNQFFDFDLQGNTQLYLIFFLFSLLVGIFAGAFPALYLSSFKPIQVLRKLSEVKLFSKMGLRKTLIVIQFSLSLLFIIFVGVIYDQTEYMLNADYGFNKDHIINVSLQGNDYTRFRTELLRNSDILQISGSSLIPAAGSNSVTSIRPIETTEPLRTHHIMADEFFVENLELKLLAGQNFIPQNGEFIEKQVMINEVAVKKLGLNSPDEAIGQTIMMNSFGDGSNEFPVQIVGVLKDFHYMEMAREIGVFCLRYNPNAARHANIRVHGEDIQETLTFIENTWTAMDPVHPLSYHFFDDQVAFVIGIFEDIMSIVGFISVLAIVIACLGLLGMATFHAETKVKEVGIRKVLGATVPEIAVMLSRGFMILLLIAIVIAVPLGVFLCNIWLEEFAYRVNPNVMNVGTGVVILFILGLITIGSQTLRAAKHDPVDALRTE